MSAAPDKSAKPIPREAPPPPPRKPRLPHNGLSLQASKRVIYAITLPPHVPLEAVLDREFWMHVGGRLRAGYLIDVDCEDGSYFAQLYVRSAHTTGAQVAILQKFDLVGTSDAAPLMENATISVKFLGPDRKYCLMAGKAVVKEGFATAEDAYRAVSAQARELAAL